MQQSFVEKEVLGTLCSCCHALTWTFSHAVTNAWHHASSLQSVACSWCVIGEALRGTAEAN